MPNNIPTTNVSGGITLLNNGNPTTIPNNYTWFWIHGVPEDHVMLELHNELEINQIEIYCSDPKFDTKYQSYNLDPIYNNRKYVYLTIIDRDPTTKLTNDGFNIIVRDIDNYVTIATIRVTYTDVTNKDALTFKSFRHWVTNNNYGNNFTNLEIDQSMLFGYLNTEVNILEETDIVNNLSLEGKLVYNSLKTMYNDSTIELKDGVNPTYVDESGKRVVKYRPVFKPLAKGGNIIRRVPCLKLQNNDIVGTSSYFKYYVIPLVTDNNTPTEQMNLPWNSVATLEFNTQYPEDINLYITEYPELEQRADGVSMVVKNQQSNLIKVVPYIKKQKFRLKVLPISQTTKAALIQTQLHYHYAWDNGNYKSVVHRYDLVSSNNNTPIDIDGDDVIVANDGVYELTLYEQEIKPYKVFTITPNNQYTHTVGDNSICSVNQNNEVITGLIKGTTNVTFKATQSGWGEGSRVLRVVVLPIPQPEITINRKLVIVAVDETAKVTISTSGVRNIQYQYSSKDKCEVLDFTTFKKEDSTYNGSINIKGINVGKCVITINGYWDKEPSDKQKPDIKEYIDVIVIPRNTYLIMANLNPCKVRLRKDIEGVKFTATTNARYIDYELPENPCFKDNSTFGPIDPNDKFSTVYNELYGYIKPLVRNKQYLHIYAHNGDGVKVATLDVLVRVLDSIDVPKDEIWLGLEHKQEGYEDNEFENPDPRRFTILKWLDRKTKEEVYGHSVLLPSRSGTLATRQLVDDANTEPKRYYEYANPGDPTRTINPTKLGSLWLNTELNKIWRCLDNEPNFNLWVCEDGRQVGPAEKLIYPGPGMPGYGQGPMSIDLHPLYGLTPLPGCYKSRSNEYGHYKDKFDNIYIYIPKFYTKLEGSD